MVIIISEIIRKSPEVNIATPSLSKPIENPKLPPELDGARKIRNVASGMYQMPNFFHLFHTASFVKSKVKKIRKSEPKNKTKGCPITLVYLNGHIEVPLGQIPSIEVFIKILPNKTPTADIPVYI